MFFSVETIAQHDKANGVVWKIAGELPPANSESIALGVAGPIAGMHNNVFMVAGGANFPGAMPWMGGSKKYHKTVHSFRKNGDSLVHFKTTDLPFSIAYAATCSTPQGILSVGGENETGIIDKVFLLEWSDATQTIRVNDLPEFPFPVTNASAVFHEGKVYVSGGERINDVSSDFLFLDLSDISSGWKYLASLPKTLSHSVMLAQFLDKESFVYVLGGRKRNPGSTSNFYASVFAYNIKTGIWKEKAEMPYALSAGTGARSGTNHILIFGGDAGETFYETEKLIAAINNETDPVKKEILNQEKIKIQSSHPGFCKQVLLYDSKKDQWQKLECMPFDTPVTTTAFQWEGNVFIPSGEIKAGVRTPKILSGKLPQNFQ
jgi:N-acetylneuraminate epimerase